MICGRIHPCIIIHVRVMSPALRLGYRPDRATRVASGTGDLYPGMMGITCPRTYLPALFPTHPHISLGVIALGRYLGEFSSCWYIIGWTCRYCVAWKCLLWVVTHILCPRLMLHVKVTCFDLITCIKISHLE